jgi:carboxylesterase
MRGIADTFAAAGYHVEVPTLTGHGTTTEDLMKTRWADWTASANDAYMKLSARVDIVVVVGMSMGGAVTLWLAAEHPEIAGIVCVNPLVQEPDGFLRVLHDKLAVGDQFMPERPNDIADPDAVDVRASQSPVACLVSLFEEGVVPMCSRHPHTEMPLLLMTSPQDHSVPAEQSDFLAGCYGGPVERIVLDRSFHVATLDYDKELIQTAALEFADKVTDQFTQLS